jgi:hypothetical protein
LAQIALTAQGLCRRTLSFVPLHTFCASFLAHNVCTGLAARFGIFHTPISTHRRCPSAASTHSEVQDCQRVRRDGEASLSNVPSNWSSTWPRGPTLFYILLKNLTPPTGFLVSDCNKSHNVSIYTFHRAQQFCKF